MALRSGKIYSKPKGYKAFLTNPVDEDDRGKRSSVNRWGASFVPSGYKSGVGAPRAPVIEATETKEDMDARRGAIDKWLDHTRTSDSGNQVFGLADSPRAGVTSDQEREVLAAVASHGTVEASQRGMYSGRTVQAPSSTGYAKGFEPEGGDLTDRQKEGIEKSVNAEIESRMEAKRTGAAYTGAHSAEEQRQQNLDYQNALVKQFGEAGAKERLGDRWVGGAEPPGDKDDEDEPAFGLMADAKGGQTSGPGPRPAVQPGPAEPDEPQLVFGSRAEAAAALMSRGAEMDYQTFAQAAAIASLPGPGDGPDYDPDASFAELVTGRISDELLSLAERVEAYDAEREDVYHVSNAEAVAMAAGVSPEVYANAAPDERLYLQEKFMDSF